MWYTQKKIIERIIQKIENVGGKEEKSMNLCHSNENIILRSFSAASASGIV